MDERSPYAVITDKGVTISTPFDAAYVERWKAEIPAHARRYNPANRSWSTVPAYVEDALSIARAFFPDLEVEDLRPKKKAGPKPPSWAESMFAAVPPHLHDPAYRALLKALHPDIGGDNVATRDLIAAYEHRRAAS